MTGETGGPLLEKRTWPLLCVIARPRLFTQGFEFFVGDNSFGNRFESALVRLNGERGKPGDLVGPIQRIGKTADAMNATLLNQLFGAVHTNTEQHVPRDRPSEFVRRTLDRPLIDREPQLGRGDSEPARRRCHAQIARKRQLRAGPHRGSIDCGKSHARQGRESTQCGTQCIPELVTFDTRQIGARAEGRRFARQNDDARRTGHRSLVIRNQQQTFQVDRVAALRASNRDDRHMFAVPVKRDGAFARRSRFALVDLYHLLDNMTSGSPSPSSPANDAAVLDPVRVRRQQVAKWSLIANRVGYLLYAGTITCFVLAFAIGFNPAMVSIMTAGLVGGSILLAPSIVLGYAVKAAEREDRENNR